MNKNMKKSLIIAAVALVVVVALILVVVLVPWGSGGGSTRDEIDYGIDMSRSVNGDGLHTVTINTNSKGEIENNSYGTLINYKPADVEKISMSTKEGNYTFLLTTPVNADGTTEATVYTLEGFEDYNLATTNPSLLTSAVCFVEFTKVADLTGENAAEYGFDAPRAEATVYYNDGTHSVVRLGDNAPGGTYCYIQFGDNETVYISSLESMEAMLLEITDLFDTSINGYATSVSDDSFDKITLGGTHLDEEIVLTANDDGSLDCYYLMASHGDAPVNTVEGSNIIGTIKSLTADAVVCVNPDAGNLKEYGLDTPFATVKTTYTYTESEYDDAGNEISAQKKTLPVSLAASKEDSDGNVYIMEEGGKLIYRIKASSVAWATTTMEKLRSEYVLNPSYTALESVTFEVGGKSYTFELSSEEVTALGEDQSQTTTVEPRVSCGGKEIDPDQFYIMYQDMALLEIGGEDEGTGAKGDMLTVTYSYLTDRAEDTVVFRLTDTQKVLTFVNGNSVGYVYKSYVSALAENIPDLASGKEIATVR